MRDAMGLGPRGRRAAADEGSRSRASPRPTGSIRLGLAAIPLIILAVNGLGVLSIDPLARVMMEDGVLATIDGISSRAAARFMNTVFPFLVTLSALAWYTRPLPAAFREDRHKDGVAPAIGRRLLDLPTVAAALTGAGWLLAVPVVVIGGWALGVPMDARFFMQYAAHSFALFGFAFIITYYGVEAVVRRFIAPRVFKDNAALGAGSRFSLSVGARLFILAGAAFALPGLILLSSVAILNDGGDNRFGRDLMPTLAPALLVIGALLALITWLKSLSIERPIHELTEAAERIGAGDLSARVAVRSADRIGALGGAFNDMAGGLAERERERGVFGRVVDPRVRDRLLADDKAEAGELRRATVAFFDLAGFTSISEALPPRNVVALLNLYFEAVSSCVEAEGGLVNKFIGDGVLAVFGAPGDLPDHAERAIRAVEALGPRMSGLNARLAAKGYRPLRFRAGLHTGQVMAGVVGSKRRQEYTVIGDAVNAASRLEALGKEYGMDLILSDRTAGEAARPRAWKELGRVQIRGRVGRMGLFGMLVEQGGLV